MRNKSFSIIDMQNYISDIESLYKDFDVKKEDLLESYNQFINNDTFKGRSAIASKKYIDTIEKGFIQSQIKMQQNLLHMYKHSVSSFAEKVDSAPDAKIDLETLDIVQADFCKIYRDLEEYCSFIEKTANTLQDNYGHLGSFTKPRTSAAKESFIDLCGGDTPHSGFINKVKTNFIRFDEEECTYAESLGLPETMSTFKQKIAHIDSMISDFKISEPTSKNILLSKTKTDSRNKIIKTQVLKSTVQTASKTNSSNNKTSKNEDISDFLKKNGIDVKKLESSDGYFIIDKPISEIMQKAGIDSKTLDLSSYDDWYITGLRNSDGSITYSLIKIREPMDEQAGGHGTAVVFKSLNINAIKSLISNSKNPKKSELTAAKNAIDEIVYASKNSYEDYDQNMLDYFLDPKSYGNYLIADFIVDKVAHDKEFKDGKYTIPNKYDAFSKFGQDALDKLAKKGIYDKKTNTIIIKDPDNLSVDEKNALLLITTENPDKYSFAAENQFHADWYNSYKDVDQLAFSEAPEIIFANYIEKHCIASDTGVGESDAYFSDVYEVTFKGKDGSYYKEQYENHKDD